METQNTPNNAKCLRSTKPLDSWFTNAMYPQDKESIEKIINASNVIQDLNEKDPNYLALAVDEVLKDLQDQDNKWCFLSQTNEYSTCKRMRSLRNFVSKTLLQTGDQTDNDASLDQNQIVP